MSPFEESVCLCFGDSVLDSSLDEGWSFAEKSFRWATGHGSGLTIPCPSDPGDYFLLLNVVPCQEENAIRTHRLSVAVNGTMLRSAVLDWEGQIGCWIPRHLMQGRHMLEFTFRHPDTIQRANDPRHLAFAFKTLKLLRRTDRLPRRRILGPDALEAGRDRLTADEVMRSFESLGDNCEFGIVQRQHGSDAMGLLRFAATPLPYLLHALQENFEGIGDPDAIRLELRGEPGRKREFILFHSRYGLTYHTLVYEDQMTADRVLHREAKKLTLLARKLSQDLAAASKIFVCKRNDPLSEEDILPLFITLRQFGDNTLLWVVPEDADHPAGTVELVMNGLLRGYIDRFAPYDDAHHAKPESWISICRNALELREPAAAVPPFIPPERPAETLSAARSGR